MLTATDRIRTEEVEISRRRLRPSRRAARVYIKPPEAVRIELDDGTSLTVCLSDDSGKAQVLYNYLRRPLPDYVQINGSVTDRASSCHRLWLVEGARLQIVVDGRIITLPSPIRHAWVNGPEHQIF